MLFRFEKIHIISHKRKNLLYFSLKFDIIIYKYIQVIVKAERAVRKNSPGFHQLHTLYSTLQIYNERV